ncbi:hypothetical protein FHS19_000262 [Paenibacillus rhizosphaerae]|uniref:Uncharacterized protein n=1 Tax=Paenibacillus rhizosphaerae TaxID=297318 RepID=A0A839TJN9_9BACL|nr:hypothetical protein [Paenibacillus rhizosphaerae]MBB3125608.1 hypothetical protein [Paenibacillus rhizosphaerae]
MFKKIFILMFICVLWLPANLETVQASGFSTWEGTILTKHSPISVVTSPAVSPKLSDDETKRLREAYGLEQPETEPRQSIGDFGASLSVQELLAWAFALFLSWAWL